MTLKLKDDQTLDIIELVQENSWVALKINGDTNVVFYPNGAVKVYNEGSCDDVRMLRWKE